MTIIDIPLRSPMIKKGPLLHLHILPDYIAYIKDIITYYVTLYKKKEKCIRNAFVSFALLSIKCMTSQFDTTL